MHPSRPAVIEADILAAMKAEAAALAREIDDTTIARLVVMEAARRAVERFKEWQP